jgi:signal transduction histidine kinase
MKIRTQLMLWYVAILLVGLALIGGWAYYEVVVEHPGITRVLAREGHTALEEFGEVMLYGGLPALALALVGGWFLMRRALSPIRTFTRAMERVQADNLHHRMERSGNHDELDRLTEVFNSMTTRLDDSFNHIREFTLHASHELKTPLTIMRGEIETKLRDSVTSSADREFFAAQLDEIARLAKIVDGLTLLAKADAGQVKLAQEPVRLDELVRDSFADAQLLARPHHLEVELKDCDETTIRGDRHRLKQLLLNLTDNAIKYNQPNGRITIGLSRHNGTAALTIANTGPGISAEKLPRVFDRFYRGDAAHSSEIEGCGLGLSIVRWIVQAHGGTIRVASDPTKLTTVTVQLPAESLSATAA